MAVTGFGGKLFADERAALLGPLGAWVVCASGSRMRRGSADTTIHERAERLADLLQLSYEAMFAWRLDGPIEFWNAGAEQLYGFASQDAIGRNSHALLQTKFPIGFTEVRSQLLNEGRWSGELCHARKDGRQIIVESRMQLLADDTVVEVNRDATERKQFEAALRESEQRLNWLAAIVESSDDAIVSKSLDGIITSWNRGAERIFGYTANEAIGQPITIVIPHDRQDEERVILNRIRRGERIDHFETVRQHKRGDLIIVSLTVSPVKNAEGMIVGASKIARDITEQKRAQEQIATLAQEIRQGHLVAELDHRVKNVLALVVAIATQTREHSNSMDDFVKTLNGRLKSMATAHELLSQSRWHGVGIANLIRDQLAPHATGSNVTIRGPNIMLTAAVSQALAMVVHELVTNAVKFGALSRPSGRVSISWDASPGGDGAANLMVEWRETGGPPVSKPTQSGYGTSLIRELTPHELGGSVDLAFDPEGVCCRMKLPLYRH